MEFKDNWITITIMNKNQRGFISTLAVLLIISIVIWLGTLGFAGWAFSGRQDYKNNTDKITEKAVLVAVEKAKLSKDAEFAEREKQPLKVYKGPSAYGSVAIAFPKSWSGYIDETNNTSLPVNAKFQPQFVPAENNSVAYALRVVVESVTYDNALKQFDSSVQNGRAKVSPFRLSKVPTILGSRIDGEIKSQKQGAMILIPLRDKTLKIWTESNQFINDFNNLILPNVNFIP